MRMSPKDLVEKTPVAVRVGLSENGSNAGNRSGLYRLTAPLISAPRGRTPGRDREPIEGRRPESRLSVMGIDGGSRWELLGRTGVSTLLDGHGRRSFSTRLCRPFTEETEAWSNWHSGLREGNRSRRRWRWRRRPRKGWWA
jgi:hypothetical protein